MTKAKSYFVTPDYSVQVTETSGDSRTDYTTEQLQATHEQFLIFRSGLHDRGLLPEDTNESREVSFVQDKLGARTMFFRIKPFAEFIADSYGIDLSDYNHASRPDLHLLQAHLQKPAIYSLPLARISHMYPQDFPQPQPGTFTVNVDGKKEDIAMGAEGVYPKQALAVIDILLAGVSSKLARENMKPSPERVLRFWALSRFVELGYSVMSRNSNVKNPALEALLLDLIRVDAPLYTAFLAISKAANPDYGTTKEFTYSSKSVAELGDIPKTFLRYMLLSE